MKDYYYILGVPRTASIEDIKKAYRKLSLKFHPDKNEGDSYFVERFKDIREAYETLSDFSKKRLYDAKLHEYLSGKNVSDSERKQREEEFRRREEDLKKKEEEFRKKQEQSRQKNTQQTYNKRSSQTTKEQYQQAGETTLTQKSSFSRNLVILGLFLGVVIWGLMLNRDIWDGNSNMLSSRTSNDFSTENSEGTIKNDKPYLYGVPPAPPFQDVELTITDRVEEGCSKSSNEVIGYIIEVKQNETLDYDLVIQDERGVKDKCYLDTDDMSNAQYKWLPYILIPGNKVKMVVQYCGSGGFTYIMYIKSLKRL